MQRRIFLAINLPDNVKNQLLSIKEKWSELPAKWVSQDNLHLTLVFLGNISEAELKKLVTISEKVGETHSPFSLQTTIVSYGPSEKNPRMVWVSIDAPKELLHLQRDLEKAISSSEQIHFRAEKKMYSPHLTLARLRMMEFRRMELEERPQIQEELSLSISVQSFEIMDSALKRTGPEYTQLQSVFLSKS